jgi:hypothetical protein
LLSLLSNKCLTLDVRRAMVSGDSGAVAVEEGEDPAPPGAAAKGAGGGRTRVRCPGGRVVLRPAGGLRGAPVRERIQRGWDLKVSQLLHLASGALTYVVFAFIGGFVGYFFAKKRTEHEVGYQRRVEVAERIQLLVVSLVEGFEAALEYVREPGPAGEVPAKEIERSIAQLERYYVQQEIWLDRDTLARLDALAAESRARQRELERLPRRYGDPNFEREHERVGAELDGWLRTGLEEAREGLTDSFRRLLGVERRGHMLLRKPSASRR